MKDFLTNIEERGFVSACSNTIALRQALQSGMVTAYVGYDATAESLHVGHLVNIMLLRWFQRSGNRPITLMGGGTTKVGDPSFRNKARPILDDDKIQMNISAMQTVFGRYLDYGAAPNTAVMVNNADWLSHLNYLDFLRDIGRHFSVNRMLSFDSVKGRLDESQSLSFLEFNYMVLQAYDFLELFLQKGCMLQMGGSDQWGNIINGIELIRRKMGVEALALTTPLLAKADGSKMGKSAEGSVWLNASMTSPFTFWQFWRNVDDQDVLRFLKLFTERPVAECVELAKHEGSALNHAKIILANDVTALCHGSEAALAAENLARSPIGSEATESLPFFAIPDGAELTILELLSRLRATSSGKDSRRLIKAGGVRLDGRAIDTAEQRIPSSDKTRVLSVGRSARFLIRTSRS